MTISEPSGNAVGSGKQAVRERIWSLLDAEGAVEPPGSAGYIPSFLGAEAAALRLADLPFWQEASVVMANPDQAQLPVRVQALAARKTVYMAVPRLASHDPFYALDPERFALESDLSHLATSQGAAEMAPQVGTEQMPFVDVVVCGSVAVDRRGVRVGKGAGYSDIEVGLLIEAGLIGAETTIVTTVHDLQVVDEPIPSRAHDFRVDYIVTPTKVVKCAPTPRPAGIDWTALDPEQLNEIPILNRLRAAPER
jgi:5-formyltetrahydrofolate cyclo-ligase